MPRTRTPELLQVSGVTTGLKRDAVFLVGGMNIRCWGMRRYKHGDALHILYNLKP